MTSMVYPVARLPSSLAVASLTACLLAAALASQPAAIAQSAAAPRTHGPAAATSGEARALRAFEAAKASKANALALQAFLEKMPKGADLHMHLSGAVYAETFLAEAVKQGLCIDPAALKFTQPANAGCANGDLPASAVLQGPAIVDKAKGITGQQLYDALVDSFSMRGFVPTPGVTGHDQFFATFNRFGGLKDYGGEWLDQVAARAAAQNEQYLEIMQTPPFSNTATLGYKMGWPKGAEESISSTQLASLRDQLLQAGLRDEIATDRKSLADAEAARRKIESCDIYDQYNDADHQRSDESPSHGQITEMEQVTAGCSVKIRFIYQVLRAFPPQQVFAQTLLGFEVASADPDVVGINFVQPEDDRRAMADYHLQMQMLDYLHSVYPNVKISLHAGELAPGMVPPEGLKFHIREAIELGHASRIGHGVDVLYEQNHSDVPVEMHEKPLLKEMADKHIMVEINLTSNDVILGIKGHDHPLTAYREAHVPVALSTDDEGVSRINLTHEYVRAAMEYGLGYLDLKEMARTSIEHSFLPGESLWEKPDVFTRMKSACAGQMRGASPPSEDCAALLKSSEKAAQQWELERRFAEFEASPGDAR